ncbi:uncharacterized protein [Littorina saxatilis]|uniref:uncharacterized protein n=1 Tax=Littorina saxatilis TaxID=31220 RepID=UPI0038B6518D
MKALVVLLVYLTWCCCSGYKISECGSDGKVDLDETRPTILTCTGITDDTVYWNVSRLDGSNFYVATCTPSTSPCSSHFNGFDAKITEHNTSTLTVTLRDRTSITGKIICGGSAMASSSTSCNLRIVHKVDKVSSCSVSVDNRDWIVTASCDVEKMFASDDNYACFWIVSTHTRMMKGSFSKTNFTENNKKYYRGTCSVSNLPMPTADGIFNYSVIINPGVGQLSAPSLEIKQPENPTLLSDCPDSMTEGQNYDCTCQASNSSPPAVITWYVGISNPIRVLQLTNVSSELDGTNYTCTQHWGGVSPKLVTYTLHVKSVPTPTTPTTKPTNTVLTTTNNAYTEDETIRERSNNNNNNDNTKDEGLPIAIIAGGAGGGLVVIIIIVVVVVVVKKRRGGSSTEQRKVDTADSDVEEHINDMYESPDARAYAGSSHVLSGHNASNAGITTEPSTVNEESETAFGYLTVISPVPQTTASAQQHNQILESDLYSSPDENGAQPPVAIATQAAPKDADVYAVVNKSDKAIPTLTMVTPTEPKGAEVYAVVNKPDKNKPTPTMVTPTAPKVAEVYAVVNKPGKAKPQETPESQIDEHAVADKARSEPKNSEGLETTISAEGETEYGSGHVYSQVNKTSPQN